LKAVAVKQEASEKHLASLIEALSKQISAQFESLNRKTSAQIEALKEHMAIQGDLLPRVVDGLCAEVRLELSTMRSELRLEIRESIAPLSERIAVL
jgi:hypothetical protein